MVRERREGSPIHEVALPGDLCGPQWQKLDHPCAAESRQGRGRLVGMDLGDGEAGPRLIEKMALGPRRAFPIPKRKL